MVDRNQWENNYYNELPLELREKMKPYINKWKMQYKVIPELKSMIKETERSNIGMGQCIIGGQARWIVTQDALKEINKYNKKNNKSGDSYKNITNRSLCIFFSNNLGTTAIGVINLFDTNGQFQGTLDALGKADIKLLIQQIHSDLMRENVHRRYNLTESTPLYYTIDDITGFWKDDPYFHHLTFNNPYTYFPKQLSLKQKISRLRALNFTNPDIDWALDKFIDPQEKDFVILNGKIIGPRHTRHLLKDKDDIIYSLPEYAIPPKE